MNPQRIKNGWKRIGIAFKKRANKKKMTPEEHYISSGGLCCAVSRTFNMFDACYQYERLKTKLWKKYRFRDDFAFLFPVSFTPVYGKYKPIHSRKRAKIAFELASDCDF